jgi:CheY-like chemotaxis protein
MARILVVDDDPAAAQGMSLLLSGDGHDVSSFTSGAEAVDALSRGSFDAVVTDLEMPNVDGHAVVRAARTHHPGACVAVVSASAREQCARVAEAGACIVSDKPIAYDEITKIMDGCHAKRVPGGNEHCPMRSRPHHARFVRPSGR